MNDFVAIWEDQSLNLLREISELIKERNNFHKNIEVKLAEWKSCKVQTEKASQRVFQNLLTLNSNLRFFIEKDIPDKQICFNSLCESLEKFKNFQDTTHKLPTEFKDNLEGNLINISKLTEDLKKSLTQFTIEEEQVVRGDKL